MVSIHLEFLVTVFYEHITAYAGLEIPVDSAVALRT